MVRETFAAAMRAELDAVVARYEALVRAHAEALATAQAAAREAERDRSAEPLKAEIKALSDQITALKAENAALKAENDRLRETAEATQALEETFAAERKFVDACADLAGSLLMESLKGAFGRDLSVNVSALAALKGRGLDGLLTQAIKDRGRSAAQAHLLAREKAALSALAAAAGCELITPPTGTKFSAASMEKASTVSEPAEEGNVVECLIPGLRLAGTEGALVFPRVVVAAG